MSPAELHQRLAALTAQLAGRPLDAGPDTCVNAAHGPASATGLGLKPTCVDGVAEGWVCNRDGRSMRHRRLFKPAPEPQDFSVDVAELQDVADPCHTHPDGKFDLTMPREGEAALDGRTQGWRVCPPGSAHRPTVASGRALVFRLLPEGRIDSSRVGPTPYTPSARSSPGHEGRRVALGDQAASDGRARPGRAAC